MPRLFTRRQALQNERFLDALRRTGNPRLAAAWLGVHRSTYTKRRAKHPAFAHAWDAALAAAHAAMHLAGGPSYPDPAIQPRSSRAKSRGAGNVSSRTPLDYARDERIQGLRTRGGELVVTRTRNGRLQLRRAPPGRMTRAAEQAFFRALSATANVRLSAAAAGFAHASFYARARKGRAFKREMRLALAAGYERIEAAALQAALPESHADDSWRHNDPPPIPHMTPDQALQLLYLHEKSVRQSWEKPHRRRRRNEPEETYTERLRAMWTAEKAREAEDAALRRVAQEASEEDWELDDAPPLPALEQVKGWSKADPAKAPHHPGVALFGGWRFEDIEKRRGDG